MKQRIIFFGSGGYTIPIIEVLREYDLLAVITTEKEGQLVDFLKKEGITFRSTHLKNKEDIHYIQDLKPTIGILASYGAILPQNVIDIFPEGILNIHPSLLPKYKGPSPIQSTILSGETETGVTVIKLDDQVDHGPIVMQEKVRLVGDETAEALKNALFAIGSFMIGSILEKLETGENLKLAEQDHSKQTFTEKFTSKDGYINCDDPVSLQNLNRMIRAFYPWPTVTFKTNLNGREKLIKLLPNKKIQVEGKRIMSYKDFINGYPEGKKTLDALSLI